MERARSRADALRIKIQNAIAAIERVEAEARGDAADRGQLTLALATLQQMAASVEQPDSLDASWLSQMVADQWDPYWPVTATVLDATQAFVAEARRAAR